MNYEHIQHPIPPVCDENAKIMILGSFPSVKSREEGFFYGHKQNRFWRVLAAICQEEVPQTVNDKKAILLQHHIALWDVIASCDIAGSSDSSITNVVPNDIAAIIANSKIEAVYTNGKTADKLYCRYIAPKIGMPSVCLPSTSPANAAWSFERLLTEWSAALSQYL